MNVELHIDELVLEGVAPGDGERVAAALRGELERLLLGQPPSDDRLAQQPEALGAQAARQVFSRIAPAGGLAP